MKNSKYIVWAVAMFLAVNYGAAARSAENAQNNYRHYCVQCHGSLGTGQGVNHTAGALSVEPRNHTDPAKMSQLNDKDIRLAITEGGTAVYKSSLMPGFGNTLSESEIDELVIYLRELCACKWVESEIQVEDQHEDEGHNEDQDERDD